uniref:Single-stranded DNA binding protein n=1 Tax=Trichogloeopsis pedicellata TaxID=1495610 RepID=A0A1G4P0G3_9FLOR|nr:Hypothetical protein ycf41 [Trichogloeopsis pedicellata]SCW24395.1 Hypothetical protein ycf41 [Trichogloeopsis pedicellata]
MQTTILTIQISTFPKINPIKNEIIIFIKILNASKGLPYYYIKAKASGETGRNIANLYTKGDYIIVESYLKYDYKQRFNILVITREHPIFLSPL